MRLALVLLVVALAPLPARGQPASPLYDAVREAGARPADAAALAAAVQLQNPMQEARLVAADRAPDSFLGGAVSLSGDRALVGAFGEDEDQGAAYVFVRQGTTWVQEARLVADDRMGNGSFGVAVALSDDRALVGAYGDDGFDGAAYVFVRSGSTWTQEARLDATGASPIGLFGSSVSLSGDRALVGAPEEDDSRGAAYVFVRSGAVWMQDARITAADGVAGDLFGGAVSVSGGRALVGAYGINRLAGAAYVFARSGSAWTQEARLVPTDSPPGGFGGSRFGFSVALSGDDALVGEYGNNNFRGAAYVFTRSGAAWTQQARLTAADAATSNFFGDAVSLSGDRALVGSSGAVAARGAAYLFSRSGTQWTQEARLAAPESEVLDIFGFSVALSGDRALVGARGDDARRGSAYVFSGVGAVATEDGAPAGAVLSAVTPNPSAGRASLALTVDVPQHVRVAVVDALGRGVAVVLDGEVSGTTRLDVDTARLAPGVYVVRVVGKTFAEARRLTVAR